MPPGKDATFGQAVRGALLVTTCPLSFWDIVARRDAEDMLPAVIAPRLFAFLLGPVGRWLALGALVVAVWCHGWLRGAQGVRDDWEAATAKQEAASLAHAMDLAKRADEITLAYITQTRTVREKGATIIREVTRYVTPDADAACPTDGLVRVLNAAARNELPSAAGSPSTAPAGAPANP